MDNQQIAYSAALHLSFSHQVFLRNFVRRSSQEWKPINPIVITRESLLKEQDFNLTSASIPVRLNYLKMTGTYILYVQMTYYVHPTYVCSISP